jgi:hypothetical protein
METSTAAAARPFRFAKRAPALKPDPLPNIRADTFVVPAIKNQKLCSRVTEAETGPTNL